MPRRTELRRDLVVLACAISAGIHGALVPDHFHEGPGAGAGFVAATVLLAAVVLVITFRPADARGPLAAVAVLLGLLVSYVLAVTTGVPVLHPEAEPIDGLALATKAVEAAGLLAALELMRRSRPAAALLLPKGTLT